MWSKFLSPLQHVMGSCLIKQITPVIFLMVGDTNKPNKQIVAKAGDMLFFLAQIYVLSIHYKMCFYPDR